ncbi:winged helix-turn-helix domain-containing protein [Roseiarcaceae bacterium H3SJ34-1]|uniref:winged helix-turn-helix domain-containing protein n=1 Tax=Terripilifer ovatus TaxID=3032367 RepID=UPI003AB99EEE|nr:winged helix-turn-helix domain-containing protein [Roseiarcaceae bacterium H3SJ34-1]
MTFVFGPYLLDEPARALRLGARELPLQPLAFDLLAYLIRHRDRVVPKDELLDTLWPDVTVTENSLQRAVSTLRRTLREGGMDGAVRNFPSKGYRFCVDVEPDEAVPAEDMPDARGDLEDARLAIDEQRWRDAQAIYERLAARGALSGEDLERWSLALQCLGKQPEAIKVLMRTVTAYTQHARNQAAAAAAVTLSTIHFERNETAVSRGWLARAQDLIAGDTESEAVGRIIWLRSRIAAFEGELPRALELAEETYSFGLRRNNIPTQALGLMYRGFYRLSLGDTRAGLADQDHASALALSNHVDPVTGGYLICNILWACRTFGDWNRANEWTLGYQQFCTTSGMQFSGSCQLHRAEVLGVRGSLADALEHIQYALTRLSDEAPWSVGDAHRVMGDIHAAMGNSDPAFAAYEKSYALGWDPEPGHAMLLLERGEPEAAYASLERSLIGQNWWTLQRQGMLLAHLALVAVHAGRPEKAQALIEDLAGQNERWPMASIRALTNEAAGLLAQQQGYAAEALRRWQLARQLWTSMESQPNAARLRLLIADAQLASGDHTGAAAELRAAQVAARALGSAKLTAQCQSLQDRIASATS